MQSIEFALQIAGRYWHDDHMNGDWWWMVIVMTLFWASVIVLIVWLIKRDSPRGVGASAPTESPEEILARRLATGEISADEYRSTLAALRGEPPT